MNPIRLLLVDDHDIVRTGLKAFLQTQEDFLVVGEAQNGEEALHLAQQLAPDVVLMDISMPGMDGLEATRHMKAACPECRVLALTVHNDKQYFFEMLAAGASGYLTKQAAADELVAAILAVAQGQIYLQPVLATWLLEDYRRLREQDMAVEPEHNVATLRQEGLSVLSERELQVLQLVAEGLTNIEIGEKLEISHKTVARHRERIMGKLKIHSGMELVKFAIRCGLIQLR